ncbi:hypothetical protein E1A91_D07G063800v1 [Gossypium mustelinum]|uniref:Uncharacterized protein n=2 Tax=Gossypium TaxID=3633 RepID=A0A5J5QN27_GOSBA|nr:hypothetical protein ES319_D07G061700v1 [Gossypium barbadense]TYI72472.1 hypothetical protein E1A91_D07G063800v1 [Gossypium mustelinum]
MRIGMNFSCTHINNHFKLCTYSYLALILNPGAYGCTMGILISSEHVSEMWCSILLTFLLYSISTWI